MYGTLFAIRILLLFIIYNTYIREVRVKKSCVKFEIEL